MQRRSYPKLNNEDILTKTLYWVLQQATERQKQNSDDKTLFSILQFVADYTYQVNVDETAYFCTEWMQKIMRNALEQKDAEIVSQNHAAQTGAFMAQYYVQKGRKHDEKRLRMATTIDLLSNADYGRFVSNHYISAEDAKYQKYIPKKRCREVYEFLKENPDIREHPEKEWASLLKTNYDRTKSLNVYAENWLKEMYDFYKKKDKELENANNDNL